MEDTNDFMTDKISIDVPNMDKNQCMILDTDGIDMTCHYNGKYSVTEIQANRSGLIALAKICLQLANSEEEVVHIELDEYNYLAEKSTALSIEKKNNT